MKVRQDRPINWLGRAFVVVVVVGTGVLAAFPFRRESPPPVISQRRIPNDSVRLVFRNQDITLQVTPHQEASPARLPLESPEEFSPRTDDNSSSQLPELPAQYRTLLDPHSTTPQASVPPIAGRVLEPIPETAPPLREHVLVDGDTLERLAERYLGSATRAQEIIDLNGSAIADPQTLPLGKVIRIPSRSP